MTDPVDPTPPEIRAGLDHYDVAAPLRSVLALVASQRGLTADPPGKGYVAVRPSAWGTVSAYFHKSYVDVAVSPHLAETLHRKHGWKHVKTNGETGFVRIESTALGSPARDELAVSTLLAAVDKSAVGTAYEGGRTSRTGATTDADVCPSCFVARAQGRCDTCD